MSNRHDEEVKGYLGRDVTVMRDYASLIQWCVNRIEEWAPNWTDWNITDPGILFVNALSYVNDLANYSIDSIYMNNILRYTQDERSLYFMSRFVGLDLPTWKGSVGTVQIANRTPNVEAFEKGFPFYIRDDSTGEELWFYTTEYITANPGVKTTVPVIEGKRTYLSLKLSDFNPDQTFAIPGDNIGVNTFQVFIPALGEKDKELEEVDDAFLSVSDNITFSVSPAYKCVQLKISPGLKYRIDEIVEHDHIDPDIAIDVVYGTVQGPEKGNVGEIEMYSGKTDASGAWVMKYRDTKNFAYKILGSRYATEPYSIENQRIYIGYNTWKLKTLVTEEDFCRLCGDGNQFPDLLRMVLIQEKASDLMKLYYVPVESFDLSFYEKDMTNQIAAYCEPLVPGASYLSIAPVEIRSLVVVMSVILVGNSSDTSAIEEQIRKITYDFLDRTKQPKQFVFKRSQLVALIETSVSEVESVTIENPTSDITASKTQIFQLDFCRIIFEQGAN